jgi:hypothetical protein
MRSDPARPAEPLSTHATMQMLARPDVQPRVAVNVATGPDGGHAEGTMLSTAEARLAGDGP